jgi:hypothetical protein
MLSLGMRKLQLIHLYFYVSEIYEKNLKYHHERFSNNQNQLEFTDIELLTTYLFAIGYEQCRTDKAVYDHISNYWLSWFPSLPSYQAYNRRLNDICAVYPQILEVLLEKYQTDLDYKTENCFILTDSMPIITCSGKRRAKVALELCNKGYNSTKDLYFYGVKLHGFAFYKKGTLPISSILMLSPGSEHDLEAQRMLLQDMKGHIIFGDKAFNDNDLDELFENAGGSLMLPFKYHRGHSKEYKNRHKAANDIASSAISKIRQPIESLFAWIIEKTDVQKASKVRSYKGLLKHVFARIASAIFVRMAKIDLV